MMHSENTAQTKLPKLMNNKSLCDDEQPTIDQTQDSKAMQSKQKRTSVESSEQSSLFVGDKNQSPTRH